MSIQPIKPLEPENASTAEQSNDNCNSVPKTQVKAKRRRLTTAYKIKILEALDACDNSLARGALLRREGLYYSGIAKWRKQRDEGLLSGGKKKSQNTKLVRENERLKKRIATAEAIIDLQKKVSNLLTEHILPAESRGSR